MKTIKIMSCMFFSGMGVGWLVGLSVSPILQIVLASVISLIVGITGVLAGLSDSENAKTGIFNLRKADPFPVTILVAGLAIGASIGVIARTNDWLGIDPSDVIQRWEKYGLEKHKIVERLFDIAYAPNNQGIGYRLTRVKATAALYALNTSDCSSLAYKHGEDLRAELKLRFKNPEVSSFLDSLDHPEMEKFKVIICPEE